MEKRLNTQSELYVIQFKDAIKNKISDLDFNEKHKVNDLLEYIFEYRRLTFSKDDFSKRKRIQNTIPVENRCNALKSSNERCTRRRKHDSDYCGTHTKNIPTDGYIDQCSPCINKTMEVTAKDINGIVYYVDEYKNIYRTEDILNEKENPEIIAKMQVSPNGHAFIDNFLV